MGRKGRNHGNRRKIGAKTLYAQPNRTSARNDAWSFRQDNLPRRGRPDAVNRFSHRKSVKRREYEKACENLGMEPEPEKEQ